MLLNICKSKIHKVRVTKKELNYQGSIGIDKKLLNASNIFPNEVVQVLNINNGSRFETYVLEEQEGSGTIPLYGPAARLGEIGDALIILSYGFIVSPLFFLNSGLTFLTFFFSYSIKLI